jgi:replicative DNA helicase
MEPKNLSFFGEKFEIKLWNQVIGKRILKGKEIYRDVEFGVMLIPILKDHHFSISSSKTLFKIVKGYYDKYRSIPFYDTIREIFASQSQDREVFFQFLNDIENVAIENIDHIRNSAKTFIQQQNFFTSVHTIEKELKEGKISSFDEAVDKVRRSIEVNDLNRKPLIFSSETFQSVDDTSRVPVSTGLGQAFDAALGGGPSRGDLCVMGAGYGVGKTTFSVIACSTAFLEGKTVFYAYFEGAQDQLISKFQAHWTGLSINETRKKKNKEFVESQCKAYLKRGEKVGGKLIIQKFDTINTYWSNVEQTMFYVEKVLGHKIDLIVIDYLECIKSEEHYGEKQYLSGPEVLRKIENAIDAEHFNCGAWILIQGKKDTYGHKDLDPTMLGGSVDLLKIAHVLITVGKDHSQMVDGKGNINFWKNRLGDGRIKFEDVIFDNAKVRILVEDFNIVSTFEKPKKERA